MSRTSEIIHTCTGTFVKESSSGLAFLFKIISIDTKSLRVPSTQWFPFSQSIKHFKDIINEDCDWFTCKTWILEKKNLMNNNVYMETGREQAPARLDTGFQLASDGAKEYPDDDIPF